MPHTRVDIKSPTFKYGVPYSLPLTAKDSVGHLRLEPASATPYSLFKAPISCQYCTRNRCTRSVSRSVAGSVFFPGELELLNDASHCRSTNAHIHPLLQSVAQFSQNGIIILHSSSKHSFLFPAQFGHATSPMRSGFNCAICALPL